MRNLLNKLSKVNQNVLGVVAFVILAGSFTLVHFALNPKDSEPQSAIPKPPVAPIMEEKTHADSHVLLKLDGKEVTDVEIFGPDLMAFYSLKQKEYDFKMARVRGYITKMFVQQEAEKLKLSPQDYVIKEIRKGKDFTPSEKEVIAFLKEQNVPEEQINEEMKAQAKQFLGMSRELDIIQAKINEWSKTHPIEIYFALPTLNVPIPVDNSPAWGKKDAKIVIVEFSDFECPFCAKAASTVKALKKKYNDDIQLVYKHLPSPNHANAKMAAKASFCVHEQNKMAFWAFYDQAFANQANLSSSIPSIVKKTGVDMKLYQECLDNEANDQALELDIQLAQQLGLRSTPTFIINGKVIQGAMPLDQMEDLIKKELKK